tara:strand:+ start:2334 stop:2864 length:531 start_codon:yes stop_codon:yes gene_type:complete
MVCNRCKTTIYTELQKAGFDIDAIELGQMILNSDSPDDELKVQSILKHHGFELIKDASKALVEKIKIALIKLMEKGDNEVVLTKLADNLGKNYALLSKTFSKSEGITLEKYFINLKIEKAKEYIQLNQHNFSEIAYSLNYKNSSHLSKQFKHVTGMSMRDYKNLQDGDRKSLDEIV